MHTVRDWSNLQGSQFGLFGNNMRQVAVTVCDKDSAKMQLSFFVPINDSRLVSNPVW